MAEFAMYGPQTGGYRVWEQDQEASKLNDLALRTGEQQLAHSMEMAPLDRQKRAAEAQKLAIEAKQMQAYMDALANRKSKTTGAQPGQAAPDMAALTADLAEMADIAITSGRVKEGAEIVDKLSSIQGRDASIALRQARQLEVEFKTQMQLMDKATGYARWATTPEKWQLAGDEFEATYGFRPSVFQQPFDPAMREQVLAAALSEKDAAQIAHNARIAQLREKEVNIRGSQLDLNRRLTQARIENLGARTQRLQKVGAKPDRADPALAKDTRALLMQNHPDLAGDTVELQVAAASISSEAQMLLRNNPALTRQQAISQAYANQKGDIQKAEQTDLGILGKWGGKVKFNALGRTPTTALDLPSKADPSLLQPGKYYQQGGKVMRWTGAKWEAATTGGAADDDEDDD